jgi:hypothetical protein
MSAGEPVLTHCTLRTHPRPRIGAGLYVRVERWAVAAVDSMPRRIRAAICRAVQSASLRASLPPRRGARRRIVVPGSRESIPVGLLSTRRPLARVVGMRTPGAKDWRIGQMPSVRSWRGAYHAGTPSVTGRGVCRQARQMRATPPAFVFFKTVLSAS